MTAVKSRFREWSLALWGFGAAAGGTAGRWTLVGEEAVY